MPVRAVLSARFAAGLFGLLLERALREGSRLALAGAALGFEKLEQALLLGFEFVDAPPQRETSRTESFLHADKLANAKPCSCASLPTFSLAGGVRR